MIPTEIEQLWANYLATERVRIRHESSLALDRFINSLTQLPAELWHPWARQLAQRVVDESDNTPIRFPLFRSVLFPALFAGFVNRAAGSARWMAGLSQLLYKSPACREQLPEGQRTEFGLLLRAVHDDSSDALAKRRLLKLMRSHFSYVLHELPTGVLYGHAGATIQQCGELLEDLSIYEGLANEIGLEGDQMLVAKARFHIPAYRRYLSESGLYINYEQFLATYDPS